MQVIVTMALQITSATRFIIMTASNTHLFPTCEQDFKLNLIYLAFRYVIIYKQH